MKIFRWNLPRMRNVSDKIVQKIKTQFHVHQLFSENPAVYVIMWKNVTEPGRPDMAIKYGFANQGYTHTFIMFNTQCFPKVTADNRKHLSITLYVHCLCRWYILILCCHLQLCLPCSSPLHAQLISLSSILYAGGDYIRQSSVYNFCSLSLLPIC